MKLWVKVSVISLGLVIVLAALFLRTGNSSERVVRQARESLQRDGFKVDLSEFDFSASPEVRARASTLLRADLNSMSAVGRNDARQVVFARNVPELMQVVNSDAAVVVWKEKVLTDFGQDMWPPNSGADIWATLHEVFDERHSLLDAACSAAIAGPIAFDLNATNGNDILLPHLANIKALAQTLGKRAVLELHEGNTNTAWTNLLAMTRLVTAWKVEGVQISQMVRFSLLTPAFNATWQALQAQGWTDEQLATLQNEWASVDLFSDLPQTVAFTRACAAAAYENERQSALTLGVSWQTLQSPGYMWSILDDYWKRLRYRNHGSYEDEKAVLLFYREREMEVREAVKASSWLVMRNSAGATNSAPFLSKHSSRAQAMLNLRHMSMSLQNQGTSFLGRAAEAEARRRILITAIALERFRLRHHTYPERLRALVPEFLEAEPLDFMDGQPLRYKTNLAGQFVLYSVGLDCKDDGGKARMRARGDSAPFERASVSGDVLWPRPASGAEAQASQASLKKSKAEQVARFEMEGAIHQWEHTATRQAKVETILGERTNSAPQEVTYRDRPLTELLRNPNVAGTNHLNLQQMLTLTQKFTGAEPEIVTFELPIAFDALTNRGELFLLVDPFDDDSDDGSVAVNCEWKRATNGNCLLVWSALFESHGDHALQAGITMPQRREDLTVMGPLLPFTITNLCQFSLSSAYFNPTIGASLYAKLPESNGVYTVDLTSVAGERLKSFSGSTSNGLIQVNWDLIDERGRRCTNEIFNSLFHVRLPDSGRSQTMKGP